MKNFIKTLVVGVMLLFSALVSYAQPAGFTKVASNEAFKNNMLASVKNMSSLQSEFTQVKHIAGMTKDIKQTGKFYFKNEDKLLLDYITPMKSQIVMNGNKIKMVSGGKSTTMDASANPAVANLKKMLSSCLSGNLPTNSADLSLTIYENASQFMVYVVPKSGNLKSKVDRIEVLIEKANYDIKSVKMIEKPKSATAKDVDYMEFSFTNMKKNGAVDDKLFNVQ